MQNIGYKVRIVNHIRNEYIKPTQKEYTWMEIKWKGDLQGIEQSINQSI